MEAAVVGGHKVEGTLQEGKQHGRDEDTRQHTGQPEGVDGAQDRMGQREQREDRDETLGGQIQEGNHFWVDTETRAGLRIMLRRRRPASKAGPGAEL